MTDALKLQGEQKYPGERWLDMVRGSKAGDAAAFDDMDGDEIAQQVIDRIGLVIA